MDKDEVVAHLDRLSSRMSAAVDGENAFCVSAAAIAVAFDAAENLTDITRLQVIHHHLINTAGEVAKLIAARVS